MKMPPPPSTPCVEESDLSNHKHERKHNILDTCLTSAGSTKAWQRIVDEYNNEDEEVRLREHELNYLHRVLSGTYDGAYVDYVDYQRELPCFPKASKFERHSIRVIRSEESISKRLRTDLWPAGDSTLKSSLDIDHESPCPSTCYTEYKGHKGAVVSISIEVTGQWIASGSKDGTVRLWEVETGRCVRIGDFYHAVKQVEWNPLSQLPVLAVAVGSDIFILNTGLGSREEQNTIKDLLHIDNNKVHESGSSAAGNVSWLSDDKHAQIGALRLKHCNNNTVSFIQWHHKGDYISAIMQTGEVMIHRISKKFSQAINFKFDGRLPVSTAFHPTRSEFYFANRKTIRVYDLKKNKERSLINKLKTYLRDVSCIAIDPRGDNVVVGTREGKWPVFDTDLSSKPYKTFKTHSSEITNVAFHPCYPLFSLCSEDGQAKVYHYMGYSDLNKYPHQVPLAKFEATGVLDCKFHPREPWLFTAGVDSLIKLYTH